MNELSELLDQMNNKYATQIEQEDEEEEITDMRYLLAVTPDQKEERDDTWKKPDTN